FRPAARFAQSLDAGEFGGGVLGLGLGLGDLGLGLGQLGFVGVGVEAEEDPAFFDDAAFGKIGFDQVSTNAGAQFDDFDGFEASGVIVPVDDLARERAGDGDGGGGQFRRG